MWLAVRLFSVFSGFLLQINMFSFLFLRCDMQREVDIYIRCARYVNFDFSIDQTNRFNGLSLNHIFLFRKD
jgi:hypothetical protein